MSPRLPHPTSFARELTDVHHGLKVTVAGVHREMKEACEKMTAKIGVVEEVVKQLNALK